MATENISLTWSSSYTVSARSSQALPGDKILLPPSALEQLLAASTVTVTHSNTPSNFDPFNPYSLAAARQEASQWRDTQQQLPHPLTFRLVNPENGNVVFAGIREFSAEEGQIVLSPFLAESLGISEKLKEKAEASPGTNGDPEKGGSKEDPMDLTGENEDSEDPIDLAREKIADLKTTDEIRIVVHAKQLPKGTYVRLRPLEAGYNPADWKSLLEQHLRERYTTLTNGEILVVPKGRGAKSEEFRFLIDKFAPEGDGICVVDTDLEVDIEALNEEQARETLKKIFNNTRPPPGSEAGSSAGGKLDIWKAAEGQVLPGEYVDYELPSWDRSQGVEFELTADSEDDLDLLVNEFGHYQRVRPRVDEYKWGDFESEKSSKIIRVREELDDDKAECIYVTVHSHRVEGGESASSAPRRFSLSARLFDKKAESSTRGAVVDKESSHNPDEEQCKNCKQWIPKRTMMLHENFCLRNNIACPHCQNVFKKNSEEWKNHWHCPHDTFYGNTAASKAKHDDIFHMPRTCDQCAYEGIFPNLPTLSQHKTETCPAHLHLCQFCHLEVPQEGDPNGAPQPETVISGITSHELACGARTTECHLCSKIVRLLDMSHHLHYHELEKAHRAKPRICINGICGRTLDGVGKNGDVGAASRMGQGPGNELGLCSICFGPLYVSMYDPSGKAMKRRIERRYLSQMIQGCGKAWCSNPWCKTGKSNNGNPEKTVIGAKEALPMIQPLLQSVGDQTSPTWFCVDEGSQKRRAVAEMLAAEGQYEMEWCVAACEAEGGKLDGARRWLENWAPKKVT